MGLIIISLLLMLLATNSSWALAVGTAVVLWFPVLLLGIIICVYAYIFQEGPLKRSELVRMISDGYFDSGEDEDDEDDEDGSSNSG